MTALDLDAIKARVTLRQQYEEGTFSRKLADANAADSVPALVAEVERLQAFIRDQAEHGTRFDLNPTVDSRKGVVAYLEYLRRIDDSIRSEAKDALREPSDSSSTGGQL